MAVRNVETWFRVWGARESETLVECYRRCIGDVNKQRALGDAQRFFTLSQQNLDELRAETSAAMSRRNGQAAEVTSSDTQVELAKPTQFSVLPDQGVGRKTRQFRVSKEGLRRKRETEFRAAPNAAAVLGRKPRHYLRHVSFRHFDELYREIVQLKPHQSALQPRTRVTPPAPAPESRPPSARRDSRPRLAAPDLGAQRRQSRYVASASQRHGRSRSFNPLRPRCPSKSPRSQPMRTGASQICSDRVSPAGYKNSVM
jgi:hypothetical protein